MLEKAAPIERFEKSPLRKELKAQNDIPKDQYRFFKDQKNNITDNKEEDMGGEDRSDGSKITKKVCKKLIKSLK